MQIPRVLRMPERRRCTTSSSRTKKRRHLGEHGGVPERIVTARGTACTGSVLVAFATLLPTGQPPKLRLARKGSSGYNSEAFARPVICTRQRPMNRTLSTGSPHGCKHCHPCEPHHHAIKPSYGKICCRKGKNDHLRRPTGRHLQDAPLCSRCCGSDEHAE